MKNRNRQKGAAVVEFAIISSLLVVFLFAIFEFGFLWLSSYYIANSAREGARVAAKINGSEAADTVARETAATAAVNRYLAEHRMFADHLSETGFITTSYTDGSMTVTADGDTITVPLSEVSVTVQTSVVWEPVLWPLIAALIAGDNAGIREITQTASFAIE